MPKITMSATSATDLFVGLDVHKASIDVAAAAALNIYLAEQGLLNSKAASAA